MNQGPTLRLCQRFVSSNLIALCWTGEDSGSLLQHSFECPLHRPRCSVLREHSEDIEVRSACQPQKHKMSKQRDDSNIKSRDLGPIGPVEPELSRGESTAVAWVWGGGLRFLQETLVPRSNAWTALRLAIITRLELLSRLRREACTSSTLLEYSKESCDATF